MGMQQALQDITRFTDSSNGEGDWTENIITAEFRYPGIYTVHYGLAIEIIIGIIISMGLATETFFDIPR